jgi:hypothetical protein
VEGGDYIVEHDITVGNDGSTDENFLNSIFVLNEIFAYDAYDFVTWNVQDERFEAQYNGDQWDYIYISYYDGIFDNSDGSIDNLREGIWPYFDLGNINAQEEIILSYGSEGNYFYMEGDTLAHVTPVPEPATIFIFLSGLLSLVGLKLKK